MRARAVRAAPPAPRRPSSLVPRLTLRLVHLELSPVTLRRLAALADVHGYAGVNRIHLTRHARIRMEERGTSEEELRVILVAAPSCTIQAKRHRPGARGRLATATGWT